MSDQRGSRATVRDGREPDRDLWTAHPYKAFVSYSRADRRIGMRFQRALERFVLPRTLRGRRTATGPVPRRMTPVFRDASDAEAAGDLGELIERKLEQSAFLIVLCSPRSAQSEWVGREVETFRRLGRSDRIIAVLVDGEPARFDFGAGRTNAFHPALFHDDGAELPLAPDVRATRDGFDYSVLKVIGRMTAIRLDELSQRVTEVERMDRRRLAVATGVFASLAVLAAAGGWQATVRESTALRRQSEFLAERAARAIEANRPDLALAMAVEGLPLGQGIVAPEPDSSAARSAAARSIARLPQTHFLVGHEDAYTQCAVSPDGLQLATASTDGTARLWDLTKGRSRIIAPMMDAIGFLRDGRLIAVGDRDASARVYDPREDRTVAQLEAEGSSRSSHRLALSPDEAHLATGGFDGTVEEWRTSDWTLGAKLPPIDGWIETLEYSPDGRRLLVQAHRDPRAPVYLWDRDAGRKSWELECPDCEVHSASFSPAGKRILLVRHASSAAVLDADTSAELVELPGPENERIAHGVWHPGGRLVALGTLRGWVGVFDSSTGKRLWSAVGHGRGQLTAVVVGLMFLPEQAMLLSAATDGSLRAWHAPTGRLLYSHASGGTDAYGFCADRNRARVFHSTGDGVVRGWSAEGLRTQRPARDDDQALDRAQLGPRGARLFFRHDSQDAGPVRVASLPGHDRVANCEGVPANAGRLVFDDAGERFAVATGDGAVRVATVEPGCEARVLVEPRESTDGEAYAELRFIDDGRRLALFLDEALEIWRLEPGAKERRIELQGIVNREFSTNGRIGVVSLTEPVQRVYDLVTGDVVAEFDEEQTAGASLHVSPSGRYIAFLGGFAHHADRFEDVTRVWDRETGRFVLTAPEGNNAFANTAVFTRDERTLFVSSYNHAIRVYDLPTGRVTRTFSGHTNNATKLWLSDDERHLLSHGWDGRLIAWDVESGLAVETLATRPPIPRRRRWEPEQPALGGLHRDGLMDVAETPSPGVWRILTHGDDGYWLSELTLPGATFVETLCERLPVGFPGLAAHPNSGLRADFPTDNPCERHGLRSPRFYAKRLDALARALGLDR